MPNHGAKRLEGQALLAAGKFADGYRLIEQEPGFYRSDEFYKLPKEKNLVLAPRRSDLRGKTVLLALEGGFGDEVAWARFAQLLKKAGARVLVGALPGSLGTLQTVRDADLVKCFDLITPDEYDYYLLGMSAADYFDVADPGEGITFPYLSASPEYINRIRPIIDKIAGGPGTGASTVPGRRPKIGIHWQGNKEYEQLEQKSYPAALLLPFAELGQLYSLQRDAGGNVLPPGSPVVDTQQGAADWEHTLAVIAEMDYIITGCTSIAHYAGALGKPVLLIINYSPSYYWAECCGSQTSTGGSLTSWYPSIRVFRQPTPGDWQGALNNAYQYLNLQFSNKKNKNDLKIVNSAIENSSRRILISAVGGLGDHATAEPIIRFLISQHPDADIRIAAHWPRMFAHLGVPVYPHNTFPAEGYKHVWTLPDPHSHLMQAACFLLCHMADFHALAMLQRQLPAADKEIKLEVSPPDKENLATKLRAGLGSQTSTGGSLTSRLVAVHAGKSWKSKTFPIEYWQQIVDGLAEAGLTVALIGKSTSHLAGDNTGLVPVACPKGGIDLRDKLGLGELFALLESAPVLLTNDSSPVQMAGAFDNWIVMLATIKHPDLVFPYRRPARPNGHSGGGTTNYKTKALYKKLLMDELAFDPLNPVGMQVDIDVPDFAPYLPEPGDVVAEVARIMNNELGVMGNPKHNS